MEDRLYLKNKKRIVIKIGSSSLIHEETGGLDYIKLEKLVRIISDLKNQDKDAACVRLLEYYQPKLTLIFCNTKKKVD